MSCIMYHVSPSFRINFSAWSNSGFMSVMLFKVDSDSIVEVGGVRNCYVRFEVKVNEYGVSSKHGCTY